MLAREKLGKVCQKKSTIDQSHGGCETHEANIEILFDFTGAP